jgi:hypothetical protein
MKTSFITARISNVIFGKSVVKKNEAQISRTVQFSVSIKALRHN